MRRKVAPDYSATGGGEAERQDLLQLSLTICNGEDLTPFVRKAFASGRPESLLLSLRHFASSKESDIEDVCKVHSQDFISAVDYLRSLLSDVDSLKAALSASNLALQSTTGPLLSSLDFYFYLMEIGLTRYRLEMSPILSQPHRDESHATEDGWVLGTRREDESHAAEGRWVLGRT